MNKAVRSSILLPPGLPPESSCLFCDIMGQLVECPCEVIALNHKSRMTPPPLTVPFWATFGGVNGGLDLNLRAKASA